MTGEETDFGDFGGPGLAALVECGEACFEPVAWALRRRGRRTSADEYLLAMQDVQRGVREISAFYDEHDIWLTTTLGQPPVPLGTLAYARDPFELRRRMAQF